MIPPYNDYIGLNQQVVIALCRIAYHADSTRLIHPKQVGTRLLELSLPFAVPAQLLKLLAAAVAFRYIRRLTNYSHTKTAFKSSN